MGCKRVNGDKDLAKSIQIVPSHSLCRCFAGAEFKCKTFFVFIQLQVRPGGERRVLFASNLDELAI